MAIDLHRLSADEEELIRLFRKIGDIHGQQVLRIVRYVAGETKPDTNVVPIRPDISA